jgi:hypothetical protein
MLSYLLSGAVALVVGSAGGFLGGRLAVSGLRRDHVAFAQETGRVVQELRRSASVQQDGLDRRPTRDDLTPFLQALSQLTTSAVTREQLEPVLQEVITRPELDMALNAVVEGLSRTGALPLPVPQERAAITAGGAVAGPQFPAARAIQAGPVLAGASGDQLASVIAAMSQQMSQINQQLGLG